MSAPRVLGYAQLRADGSVYDIYEPPGEESAPALLFGGTIVPLISQADATAGAAKLRALLVEARGIVDFAQVHEADHDWHDRRRAWLAALAETEGAT